MPIYEYQCSACMHQVEIMQKMSDEPLRECPQCHQPTLNKLVSAAGFQLKGTGWYVTDYSAKGKAKTSDTPKKDSGSSTSSTGSTS
jgi:putative FmdB family regulatory protein